MKKRALVRGGLVLSAFLGFGLVPACGGGKDDPPGDGDIGDGDGDGDGDISLGGAFGDGDGDGDGDGACGEETVEAAPLAANVLLVVDTSGSMTQIPAGFDDTKWNTLVSSLKVALPEVQDVLSLGLKMFPSGDTGGEACSLESGTEVPVGPGADVMADIEGALDGETPEGQTPTAAALADALAYFQSEEGMALEGDNYVLLATDGGPNCNLDAVDCTCKDVDGPTDNPECGMPEMCTTNLDPGNGDCSDYQTSNSGSCCLAMERDRCLDDAGTLDAVEALAAAGIKTIVLGMPGTEAYADVLDALAVAGGLPASSTSPKYVKVDDAAGLTESMRSVTRNLVRSCEIELKETPADYDKVNVYLDGEVIPQDDADGWKYDMTTDPYTVVLTGPTCTEVEEQGVENITIRFGCQTIVVR